MSQNFSATRDGIPVAAVGPTPLGTGFEVGAAPDVLIDNRGTVDAFIKFGPSGVTASVATSFRVPAGAQMVFSKGSSTHIAVAVASGTPALVLFLGEGI